MNWADVKELIVGIVILGLSGAGAVLWSLYLGVKRDAERAHARIEKLGGELATYREHVAGAYVTSSELGNAMSGLQRSIENLTEAVRQSSTEARAAFSEIHRRIDQKADK
jgi:hypothetical protein